MSWKIRSKIYHTVFKEYSDNLAKERIIEEFDKESIIKRAVNYCKIQTNELYYPGKSYAVAIVFAYLLEREFGETFLTVLDDPNLLYENDPYFKRYSEDKETYDLIIDQFPFYIFEKQDEGSVNFWKTFDYFYEEMLLAEHTRIYAPIE